MQRFLTLVLFLVFVISTVAVSTQFGGGDWYRDMNQPDWSPSALVLAAVWAVLYVLLAVSAWMVWDSARGASYMALFWWFMQLLMSVVWAWLFFDLHRVGWAMAAMAVWLLISLMTVKSFRSFRLEASSLMMPVSVWLMFSLWLNFNQWQLNGGGLGSLF